MWSSSRSRLWRFFLAFLLTTILATTAVVNYSLSLSHSANTRIRRDLVESSAKEANHLRVLEQDFILTEGSGLSDLESSKRVLSERLSSIQTPSSSAAGRDQALTTSQANAEPNDNAKQVVSPSIQAIQSSASYQDREGHTRAQSLSRSTGDGLQRETESQARNEVTRTFMDEEAGVDGTGGDYVNGGRAGSLETSEEEKINNEERLQIENGRGGSVVYFLQTIKREIDAWASGISAIQAGAFQRWRTCAVVGNGGRLIGSGHGALIDSHTMVMRMNNAPVKGFEADVGRKTTISFINGHRFHACAGENGCACFSYGDDVAVATYPCADEHDDDVRVCKRERPGSLIFVMDRGFRDLCNRIVGTYHARALAGLSLAQRRQKRRDRASQRMHFSSGMQGVTLFSVLCEQVSLFGFGSGGNSHHYFENKTQHEFPDHDYEAESRFYDDLAKRQWSNVPFIESLGGQLANLKIYQ